MEETSAGEDKISKLPDPILHKILSAFATKDVVRTMILSKRWKNVWTSTPHLILRDPGFQGVGTERSMTHFINYINSLLLLRDSSDVHEFRLLWEYSSDCGWITKWTKYAVNHNVKILQLNISAYEEVVDVVEKSSCIFTCQSLEVLILELEVGAFLGAQKYVSLPKLKRLRLDYFTSDYSSFKNLLNGCPVLEVLTLVYCGLTDLDIVSPTLKILNMRHCDINGTTARISCPNLVDLCIVFNDVEVKELVLEDLSSLVDATIQVDDFSGYESSDRSRNVPPKPLLFRTSRAEDKDVSRHSGSSAFPELKNLTLNGVHMDQNYEPIAFFLKRSLNLKLLILQKVPSVERSMRWAYECPHFNYETVVICGDKNEQILAMMVALGRYICGCNLGFLLGD